MYIVLKNQKGAINIALEKAGSERGLAEVLGVVKSAIYYYKYKDRPIRKDIFCKLVEFLGLEESDVEQNILKQLDKNWKQKIGGKNSYLKKVNSGTFRRNLIKMRRASREMHKQLREKLCGRYFLNQYERFRKVGWYKFKTERGEIVRNILEKRIADKLFQFGINYQYEPCININKNYYFPDFKVNNIIIECTMWRGFDKPLKLSKKVRNFEKMGYKVFVIVPNNLRRFYKRIENYLIDEDKILNKLSPRMTPS